MSETGQTDAGPPQRRIARAARQFAAIRLLASGCNVAHAARSLGINPRTIFRWLGEPRFRAELGHHAGNPPRMSRNVAQCRGLSRNVPHFKEK